MPSEAPVHRVIPSPSDRFALATIVALFLCRAVAAALLVPPWQGPDEPSHFAWIKLLAAGEAGVPAARQQVERDLLASMAANRWWEHYQDVTPSPVPESFAEVPEHLNVGNLGRPSYYWFGAFVLRAMQPTSLDGQYWLLRIVSVAAAVLTLLCGWAGLRQLFDRTTSVGTLALAALHPQFLLTSISVNPDVLINLCGAAVWWRAACLYAGAHSRIVSIVVILGAATIAAMAKRNGMPLLVIAAVVLGWWFLRGVRHRRTLMTPAVWAGGAAAAGVALVVAWSWLADAARQLWMFGFAGLLVTQSWTDLTPRALALMIATGIDTSWLVAGWLRFPAPEPWLWSARVLTLAGFAGSLHLLWRSPGTRESLAPPWVFVGIAAGALLAAAFAGGSIPQGRYFFVSFIPAMALIWIGVQHCLPRTLQPSGAVLLVGAGALLDIIGFATVLIPAYLN